IERTGEVGAFRPHVVDFEQNVPAKLALDPEAPLLGVGVRIVGVDAGGGVGVGGQSVGEWIGVDINGAGDGGCECLPIAKGGIQGEVVEAVERGRLVIEDAEAAAHDGGGGMERLPGKTKARGEVVVVGVGEGVRNTVDIHYAQATAGDGRVE